MPAALWPLNGLVVSTPRLSLRYLDDAVAERVAELAAEGIHDPATMPFSEPWTDVAPPQLQWNALRYFWRCRAETTVSNWHLDFAVHAQGDVVGVCSIDGKQFPSMRTATTGSWLGRRYQGRGLGREMRQAALHLIFAGLDGERATTRAWHDNIASLRVTRSLPYIEDGATKEPRRDRVDTMLAFSMTRARWETVHRNDIEISGLEPAREFLGL
ncbi:GNAT family N-acetyltransferase [Mycolicibacterium hippocampi]|uniref:Putative succinyl-CoA transferase n=1 Tax=Mycolicibacterium hippocampi TaxID=659824 RepID=A0A7I9ZFZ6_9MYCO|nr:GNAT family N-acetyltransferase [Mycolicibacterium hippocampi]GFG99939.1 putative succinyl-CoA transferase [Mycolicibacterium hippocampi]